MMKKLLALVLALAMIMMVGAAFAAEIDVQNVIDGETYNAYKILNYRDNGKTGDDRVVSYYLTASEYASIGSVLEAAGFTFTASADGSEYFVNNAENFDAAGAAEYLGGHLSDLGNALGKYEATGESGEATFTNLPTGYFFITSSAGSLCGLHEDTDIATVVEKNTIPEVDKTEKTTGDDYVDGPVDAGIGDTVHYQIVVTDGIGTNNAITLTDTMTAGLDYTAGSIKINGTAVADDADTDNWTVTVSGRTITIVFKAAYVATVDNAGEITVTYDATINKDAVVDSATANENKVELTYSEQSMVDKVYVETYDFVVKKVDEEGNYLEGAEFKLYDAATDGKEITLSKDDTGYVKDPAGTANIVVDSADGVNVRAFAPGDYYLEEVVVPNGYNKLAERVKVTITSGNDEPVVIEVENKAGAELPSTGGIGTTIFYVVGGLLIIGAAVILVARRKAHE